jgi:hypothetical protein
MSILTRCPILFQSSKRHLVQSSLNSSIRHLSGFSFAGPRNLNEIMKTELLRDKDKKEISNIWMAYHENKKGVHGTCLNGKDGELILKRAMKS